MTDSEKLVQLISEIRERHNIPPDMMAGLFTVIGLIRYSETVKK